MLLYHYSKQQRHTLLTLEKQGVISKEDRDEEEKALIEDHKRFGYLRPGYYFEHISFFFEPPPLDIMSTIFPNDHPVWFKGNPLYEHVIDTDEIKAFQYEVVEFPEKTDAYYNQHVTDKEYYRILKEAVIEQRYIGKSRDELERIAQRFNNDVTHDYFKRIKIRNNYDKIMHKYAATVPHVMLYPHLGTIKVQSVTKVKVQ